MGHVLELIDQHRPKWAARHYCCDWVQLRATPLRPEDAVYADCIQERLAPVGRVSCSPVWLPINIMSASQNPGRMPAVADSPKPRQ